MQLITTAQVFLTHKCQLNCKYCYENFKDQTDMSFETLKGIVDYIANNALKTPGLRPHVSFFGGEPLLCYDSLIVPIIDYIKEEYPSLPFTYAITTNGLLLTEDIIKFFKKEKVEIMLSLDGNKEAHNLTRGERVFEQLEDIIPTILKYRPLTAFRMTCDPLNVKYFADSVKYFDEIGVQNLVVYPNIFIDWIDTDLAEWENQLNILNKYYIDRFEDYEVPLFCGEMKRMCFRRVAKEYCEEHNFDRILDCCIPQYRCGFCYTGRGYFDVDGQMYTCAHLLGDEKFRIERDNVDEAQKFLEANQKERLHSSEDCSKCPLNLVCDGGCCPNNYLYTGEFTNVNPNYCKWMKILYNKTSELIDYFDERKNNLLFKDFFFGAVSKRGGW